MRIWLDAHGNHSARFAREARQRIGRIVIAGSDSGWDAYTHVAIDQAHRAVMELTAQAARSAHSPAAGAPAAGAPAAQKFSVSISACVAAL